MNAKESVLMEPPTIISQFCSADLAIGQCDACSPVPLCSGASSFPTAWSPQTHVYSTPPLMKQSVNARYHAVLSPIAPTFAVLNESALRCLQLFSFPTSLTKLPMWVTDSYGQAKVHSTVEQMQQLGLIVPENHANTSGFLQRPPKTLAAWLHVTDRCNLRCAYCYVPHRAADMPLKTGKAALEAIYRSAITHQYKAVKLKYAGGEPLLRFDLIQKLHHDAQQLTCQHNLQLEGVIISNGTLLNHTLIREMLKLNLRLTISLDHLQHGVQRMYPDGRNSAADAMRAIEIALESGLTPDISITVSGQNVQQLPDLLDWVLARDLPFSLNFYRPHNEKLEIGNLRLDEDRFVDGMLAAYKVIEANLPERSLLASLADMTNFAAPHLRRCSVGHSYLVFDTEGRVSKCQMQMGKPVADVHTDDPLAVVRADRCGIQNVTVDEKEGCQDCQWKYWCAGGCPLETYRMTGRDDVKSPNCNIYRTLYPEVIRLEGLRLLKYAGKQ